LKTLNYILVLLLGLGLTVGDAVAQDDGLVSPVYGWHSYTSHKRVTEISVLGDSAYAITAGGLIRHNLATRENVLFSTVEGLSNVDPSAVLADLDSRKVFIGYKDGSINYFDPDGQLHVVTDIARTDQFTTKRINHLFSNAGLLYLATDFGVVVYDIAARETRFSATKIAGNATGSLVNAVTVAQGRIWISMENLGIWSIDVDDARTTLPDLWRREDGLNALPSGRSSFICSQGELVFAQIGDTIFQKRPQQNWQRSNFPIERWNYLNAAGGNVYATYRRSGLAILYPDSNLVLGDNLGKISCVAVSKFGDALIGDSLGGLQTIQFGTGFSEIGPACPKNNNVADMAAAHGELYVAPKGRSGSSARAYDKSGIPFYDLHQDGWHVTDHISGPLTSVYQDFYRVAIDSISAHAMLGSWGEGMVEMLHGEFQRYLNNTNSGLHAGITGHLVSGLQYDPAGNLWITQGLNDVPLQCLTPDGQWYSFQSPFSLNAYGLIIDDLGNKWMINNAQGIVVFNDNYTPADKTDDNWRQITSNFGQGSLPNNSVFCMAQDHDLQVWIGTSEGVTIMYDPTLLYTTDFQDAACPIIDGYCLFRDQQVNDIAVDGYNRKWIATENGVFLVNLDGTAVITHFTEANSPLLDDDVRSLTIDPQTGEVFFGTAKGIVSYIGDAIDGLPNAETLYTYPNPAYVDQTTPIMIKGMRSFSKVKIATASGRLVRELDSQGGEVPWDLQDTFGNRITPGIYLVMVSDPDGKGAGIAKIAILEKQN
jgi:ligand-binding sensor domain-containing protein